MGTFGQFQKVEGVKPAKGLVFVMRGKLLQSVDADRLQHAEARFAVNVVPAPNQALVGERTDEVECLGGRRRRRHERGVYHSFGGLNGEAAGEDGEATEAGLLVVQQEVM